METKWKRNPKQNIVYSSWCTFLFPVFNLFVAGAWAIPPIPLSLVYSITEWSLSLRSCWEPKKPTVETPRNSWNALRELLSFELITNSNHMQSKLRFFTLLPLPLSTDSSLVYWLGQWPVGAVAYRLIIKLKITKPKAWSVAETRLRTHLPHHNSPQLNSLKSPHAALWRFFTFSALLPREDSLWRLQGQLGMCRLANFLVF